MLKWGIELSKFRVDYQPWKVIKAQKLTDFVAEVVPIHELLQDKNHRELGLQEWTLHVDGSVVANGAGVGILLTGPNTCEEWKYITTFSFPISNNTAEYEALIDGLELAIRLRVEHIQIFTDSQLVARQMLGEYEVHEEMLDRYYMMVKGLNNNR
ncbi:hypothetical protein HRI_003243500 [Hibiscus trionum]|uniref:RNase H type-1 domain-containing protein n=1 Tax=Hibiscus trionum TaxID=183268 RepID=A0A9W7IFV4_HIBTR|nr:hypothetical protein HRI_003243500 [Hibiscus trionum]